MTLSPLGILASSGGGAAGAYELISTAAGTGSSNTITFGSIPGTYKHLQIRAVVKSTYTFGWGYLQLRINGDTASNYNGHDLLGNGSSVTSYSWGSQDKIWFDQMASDYGAGNAHTVAVIDLLDYAATTKNKTTRALFGSQDSSLNKIALQSGLWRSTSAITSVSLLSQDGNFKTTSRISLYGIKG